MKIQELFDKYPVLFKFPDKETSAKYTPAFVTVNKIPDKWLVEQIIACEEFHSFGTVEIGPETNPYTTVGIFYNKSEYKIIGEFNYGVDKLIFEGKCDETLYRVMRSGLLSDKDSKYTLTFTTFSEAKDFFDKEVKHISDNLVFEKIKD